MEKIRVSTLDSFFGQIGETMAYELGIPRDKDVCGDNELAYQELITEALREALNDRTPEEIETLLLRLDLKKSWNKDKLDKPKGMISDLTELVTKTLPLLRLAKPEAWNHEAPERLGDFLSGEIDRIDRNEQSGVTVVIDYKTGHKPEAGFDRATGKWSDFQLLLYMFLLQRSGFVGPDESLSCGYFWLPNELKDVGLVFHDWTAEEMRLGIEQAEQIALTIQATDWTTVLPTEESPCAKCYKEYSVLCQYK